VCALSAAAAAADLNVPADFPNIQAAITAAEPGDTVIVSDGLYTGPGNRDLSFQGKAITVRSANGPDTCMIDCQATPERPIRGIQFVNGEGPDSVLDGFTITGGATPPGAIADQFNGGGILFNNSSPTVMNCIIRDNGCGCWGGGVCCTNASPTLINCRIVGNHADDDGGGFFAWQQSNPVLINTVISGNDATVTGGGVAIFGGAPTIINSTITGNDSGFAGGMHVFGGTIVNSIIWGNTGNEQIWGTSNITFSNIEGGYEGIGNLDVDPMFVDPESGDFHLMSSSPLIDAGRTTAVPSGVIVDVDGDPRVIAARVDMGADEVHRTGDVNFDGGVDVSDLVALIVAWGACDGCPEDVNDDGVVGVADLVEVILAFD
jgi:hypothetical protein